MPCTTWLRPPANPARRMRTSTRSPAAGCMAGRLDAGTPLLARRRVHSPEQGDTPCSTRTSRAAAQDQDPREAGQPVSGTAISSTQRRPARDPPAHLLLILIHEHRRQPEWPRRRWRSEMTILSSATAPFVCSPIAGAALSGFHWSGAFSCRLSKENRRWMTEGTAKRDRMFSW